MESAPCILIVDDEPDILEFLSYNFRKQKYKVHIATNGFDALRIIEDSSPDLIIADIMMPAMSGIEFCQKLRLNPLHKNIPFLFLSAIQDDAGVLLAGMLGDEFISKPVSVAFLFYLVEKYLPSKNFTLS